MGNHAIYNDWVELRAGDSYGTRFHGADYRAAIHGYIERAPVGVWPEGGTPTYIDGFEPTEIVKHLLDHQAGMLTWEQWVAHRLASNDTYGSTWTIVQSDLEPQQVLATKREAFFSTHRPVTWQAAADDEPADPDSFQPQNWEGRRFVLAQSWWLASEIVRRHPELIVHEIHPGDGMYDVLRISLPGGDNQEDSAQVMLNRNGSIQVHHPWSTEKLPVMLATWLEVTDHPDPHHFVKQIERAAGYGHPGKAPASTPKSLAYRFLSTTLTMMVNDRHRWDARNGYWDTASESGWIAEDHISQYLYNFPAAMTDLQQTTSLGVEQEPYCDYWALLRDDHPVAIVSIEGRLYLPDHTADLATQYRILDRNMHAMVANLLLGELN